MIGKPITTNSLAPLAIVLKAGLILKMFHAFYPHIFSILCLNMLPDVYNGLLDMLFYIYKANIMVYDIYGERNILVNWVKFSSYQMDMTCMVPSFLYDYICISELLIRQLLILIQLSLLYFINRYFYQLNKKLFSFYLFIL